MGAHSGEAEGAEGGEEEEERKMFSVATSHFLINDIT